MTVPSTVWVLDKLRTIGGSDETTIACQARLVIEKLHKNVQSLFTSIGAEAGTCKGCGATVWWVITKNGRRAPFTRDGLNHFGDCPNAGDFRRGS